jgi:hypothetical protein
MVTAVTANKKGEGRSLSPSFFGKKASAAIHTESTVELSGENPAITVL